jgi:hypothetical protein
LHALTPQTPAAHAALRDRLYIASFLASFNVLFPILSPTWEGVYLHILHDDAFTPPLHWIFQYSAAIAMGALMHKDVAYANESAGVARHIASALFDEAHTEVLRGLLLLSCLLMGMGQGSRASCYMAVANRMVSHAFATTLLCRDIAIVRLLTASSLLPFFCVCRCIFCPALPAWTLMH